MRLWKIVENQEVKLKTEEKQEQKHQIVIGAGGLMMNGAHDIV